MTTRRKVLTLAALALAAGSGRSRAGETAPFTREAFEAAQAAGRPIVVAVSAPWCPICRTQRPILARLAAEPRFKDLVILDIDFDARKDLLRTLNVRMQSTLIVYKGATEVGRSVGESQPEWIEGLIETAL